MTPSRPLPLPDYEPRDARPGPLVLTAALLALAIGVVLGVSAWIYRSHYAHATPTHDDLAAKSFRHGPDWRSGIEQDWVDQDRRVRDHLTTYGWVDRQAGVVHIPIDRAMALISQENSR